MTYQTLKYIFIRIGLSFFLLVTLGFFTLYFIHEVALPNAVFNDTLIQWLIFVVCIFFGFFAYGLIGEQRFHNAMHKFKDIPNTADPDEVIGGFQAVLDFTYSSSFLPGHGRRLRNLVIMQFADYLLFVGREDDSAQKIYLKAFLLKPQNSPYRTPLLSILGRGGDLTDEEIDLLLVILKAEKFCDDAIINYLAVLFLNKHLFTRKTEPIFLSAIENDSEDSEKIVDFILPRLLEKQRSDSFALSFYLRALQWESPEVSKVREIVARAYCAGIWKGVDPSLHQKCEEVFQGLDFKHRDDMMREIVDSRLSSKVKKIKLFSKDDMEQLGKIKIQLGISKSFIGYFKDRVYDVLKFFKIQTQTFVLSFFKLRSWIILFTILGFFIIGLSYLEWRTEQERAFRLEKETEVSALDKNAGNSKEVKIHTLQVAAFTSFKQAHGLINSLKKKGIRGVYQVKTKRKSGEIWYKIRIGRFDSKESARKFASQLISKKSIKNYFIISLPIN